MTFKKGCVSWNKDLTKETSPKLKQVSDKVSKSMKKLWKNAEYRKKMQKAGNIYVSQKGREKLSKKMRGKHTSPQTEFRSHPLEERIFLSKTNRKNQDISLLDDEDFWKWFGGFFDGEGCFYIDAQRREKTCFGATLHPRVSIGQYGDRKFVIQYIRDELGYGRIQTIKPTHSRKGGLVWWADNQSLCYAVAKKLISYLKAKKKACQAFVDACELINANEHLTKTGFLEVVYLGEKVCSHKQNRKYDYEWWKTQLENEVD